MTYVTLKNEPLLIDPILAVMDQGWTISNTIARHEGCFPGIITLKNKEVVPGNYIIQFEVEEYTYGGVYPIVGGVNGINVTSLGLKTQAITVPSDPDDLEIKFYSDGTLGIKYMDIYPVSSEGEGAFTMGFNASENKWPSDYSFHPEYMLKYLDEFITFKDGKLWKHNVNPIRNNFYDVQYTSKIRLICNVDHQGNKLWYNLRLDSKGAWFAPYIATISDDQFPNGMETRLKKGNFKSIDGKLWADILRDMNDPNFATIIDPSDRKLQALFKGRKMQGCCLIIELECADTTEAKLSSVEVYYTDVKRTF